MPCQMVNYHRDLVTQPWRTSLKPLHITQPEVSCTQDQRKRCVAVNAHGSLVVASRQPDRVLAPLPASHITALSPCTALPSS